MPTLPPTLSRNETLTLLTLSGACFAILANTFSGDGEPLIASLALSGIAFSLCYSMIRWLGPTFVNHGFKGRDLCKPNRPEIPECMGAVCAVVYLIVIIVFIPFPFYKDIVAATSGGGNRDVVLEVQHVNEGRFLHRFPHSKLASYLSAIISLQTIALLGLGDDLFDIRWRHKWWIPGLACIPILVVYFVDFGVTSIVIPIPLQPHLGELFDVGVLYYVYMACVAMFCPQSINMLAGINGIEVSQSIVIALLLVFNDCLYLFTPPTPTDLFSSASSLSGVSLLWLVSRRVRHLCFSGMVAVVVSSSLPLSPHPPALLLLLLWVFGLVPCPRHRLPKFNARTGLLEPSVTTWDPENNVQPRAYVAPVLHLLARFRLLKVTLDDKGRFLETSNFTLLNLWLVIRGPMREDRLAAEVTALQFVAGALGLFARHRLALLVFKEDNLGKTHR
ncbi:hypothetical protein jhhlp_003434 [Lomentospora prolificans]|uniref:UDP-N-acetylglucosamine--dolichyl-phosphate N-acetylglucosaminephosphotransferase n=1 Tax=Lomentospora prolificans TaxID=41688 RepID=A0A2N3N8R9_9PEZI|nr:hypothetical protein jhhlp_003434 [Lomentospora prolificans]